MSSLSDIWIRLWLAGMRMGDLGQPGGSLRMLVSEDGPHGGHPEAVPYPPKVLVWSHPQCLD